MEAMKENNNTQRGDAINNNKKIYITPTGAIIAIIFFFIPWVKMSCMGETRYASGADLSGVFWIIFGAAVLILLAFIYFKNQEQLEKATPIVV